MSDSSCYRQRRVMPKQINEHWPITALLNDSILLRPSSVELASKSFVIERRTILPGEKSELNLQHHFLILWDGHVVGEEIPAQLALSVLPVDNQVVPALRCNPTVLDPCVLTWLGWKTSMRTSARGSVGFECVSFTHVPHVKRLRRNVRVIPLHAHVGSR